MVKRKQRRSSSSDGSPNTTNYDELIKRIRPAGENLKNVKAAFYGRSGTGKTTLSATFPAPILLLDIKEEGEDSIADMGKTVKVLPIYFWEEIEQIYWYLKSGDHQFKTVVIDTVTQMQALKMEAIKSSMGKSGAGLITKQMWGMISGELQTWIINYRDLPMNVVFLAQDRVNKNDDGDDESDEQLDPEVGPAIMPSAAKTLNASVKVIGQTYLKEVIRKEKGKGITREVEYRLRLGPHAFYTTKIRKPRERYLPEFITNPTYDMIAQIIRGEYKPPETKTTKGKVKKDGKKKQQEK